MATEISKRDSMDATTENVTSKLKSTTLSAPSGTSKSTKATFTSLPTSIRDKIYSHVLDTELVNLSQENVSYTHSLSSGTLQFKASRPPFPVCTSLFYVNRQISREALRYFYAKNLFVRFEIYTADARHAKAMLEDSGVLFTVATPDSVANSKQHAMDLTILEKNSAQKRAAVMFPAQYLPRLINFFDQARKATKSWTKAHSLFVNVLNTYEFPLARLQGDLLELFRLLDGFAAVTIESKVLLPGYAEALHDGMTAEEFTADAFLRVVTGASERAEQAFADGEFEVAAQQAQSGIITLTYGYLTRPETLHMQPDTFHKAIQRVRWQCELMTAKALFALHEPATGSGDAWMTESTTLEAGKRRDIAKDMLTAETAVSQALSLVTDSPNPNSNPWFQSLPAELIPPNKAEWFTEQERAVTWFQCGVVHTVVGEYLFAAGDLERACGLDAKGVGFEKAFDRARQGIDWNVKPGGGLRRAARLSRS